MFCSWSWTKSLFIYQQIRYFVSQGYNVVAPDFPGHGFSEGNQTTSIEEDMLWLAELLAFLKIEKATFIGHHRDV